MASQIDQQATSKPIINLARGYSKICSEINQLDDIELKQFLQSHSKSQDGCKEVLRKRSKQCIPIHGSVKQNLTPEYLLVLDFECTCDNPKPLGFRHEIIEFPIVLLNTRTLKIEAEFHSYCRPIVNPILTRFCLDFTGITQVTVNSAPTFAELLPLVNKWVFENVVEKKLSFAFATDGPWDFAKFLYPQCAFSHLSYPGYAKAWVNVRKHFSNYYGLRGGITFMLECLGKKFVGEPHSGIDDAKNLSCIVVQMLEDGACLVPNESLSNNSFCCL